MHRPDLVELAGRGDPPSRLASRSSPFPLASVAGVRDIRSGSRPDGSPPLRPTRERRQIVDQPGKVLEPRAAFPEPRDRGPPRSQQRHPAACRRRGCSAETCRAAGRNVGYPGEGVSSLGLVIRFR